MIKLDDNSPMPFGQHKEEKMINVPASDLLWYYDQEWIDQWPKVKRYIEENYEALLEEQKSQS